MAHISLSPPTNSGTFAPLTKFLDRTTKDGPIPVINFCIGSHYNAKVGGELTIDSTGDLASSSVTTTSSKLEIAADANTGSVTKSASFASFMYFYPGVRIVGHLELQDATDPTVNEQIQYVFSDLATNDVIWFTLNTGVSNPQLLVRETHDGVNTTLATVNLAATTKEIDFELDFLDEGITKIYYKDRTQNGDKTRIFKGALTADLAECKVECKLITNATVTKTCKSDYIWIFYKKIYISYDVELADRLVGRCRVWDTNNEADEANWDEVFSADHKWVGERVCENGIIRIWFKVAGPTMDCYGWSGTAWEYTGGIVPQNTQGSNASEIHDIIFERFNNTQLLINAKYGLLNHKISLRRGMPYVRISATSKRIRVATNKERVALSVGNTSTDIQNFNQEKTDDANRGNPLNLSPTDNPFIFTDDNNADTGLDRIDDNWFAWYDTNQSNDTLGFVGLAERPTACQISAINATTLNFIEWTTPNFIIICYGVLNGATDTVINNVLPVFTPTVDDAYVKYRANEGIFNFNSRMTLRRKR
jgi:hypothetical protein